MCATALTGKFISFRRRAERSGRRKGDSCELYGGYRGGAGFGRFCGAGSRPGDLILTVGKLVTLVVDF